jgi:predicted transposase/invertase (TIGR01784 family)
METDSFFWQLLKELPDTLFVLLGLPVSKAAAYRFDAVELKKTHRLDGVLIPKSARLPLYFVEVQFQRRSRFYANLFAKVFLYLEANDPGQDWHAVALFANRKIEPKKRKPYRALLESPQVHRLYLDELSVSESEAFGARILQLFTAPDGEIEGLVHRLVDQAQREIDAERGEAVLQLIDVLLMRRYDQYTREEIQRMFKLADLRKTRVWQEAREEGQELARRAIVQNLRADGKSIKEIAQLLKLPEREVRRLTRGSTGRED